MKIEKTKIMSWKIGAERRTRENNEVSKEIIQKKQTGEVQNENVQRIRGFTSFSSNHSGG